MTCEGQPEGHATRLSWQPDRVRLGARRVKHSPCNTPLMLGATRSSRPRVAGAAAGVSAVRLAGGGCVGLWREGVGELSGQAFASVGGDDQ